VLFVAVARAADCVLELDAASLLDDVGRFVGGRVKVGRPGERDLVSGGVGLGADVGRRASGVTSHVSLDAAHVMTAEGRLDLLEIRAGTTGPSDACRCPLLNGRAASSLGG